MGEVRFEQHAFDAHLVDQALRTFLLEPKARIKRLTKLFRRSHPVALHFGGYHLIPLVFAGFENEGNPSQAAFHRHESQLRKAFDDVGIQQVHHDARIVHVQHRGADGGLALWPHGGPRRLLKHPEVCAADVKIQRQIQIAGALPKRNPVVHAEVRQAETIRRVGNGHAGEFQFLLDAYHFLQGLRHAPERQNRLRGEPSFGVGLHFGDGIVIDLHASRAQRIVFEAEET